MSVALATSSSPCWASRPVKFHRLMSGRRWRSRRRQCRSGQVGSQADIAIDVRAVVISLREYESLKETAFLLGIPANARHLAASIESLRSGQAQPHELIEDPAQDTE
ncbi:hypothetical protein OHA25_50375 [Nonomuraea sp. NBC_00507]|uniref:type II toxin-antitoxin system Phd/YefM family antitoxin n=1 Tax=Nonomuraea sp. NBC_00507 TaxID=2976002 RepID=UPI002E18F85A